MWKKRKTTRTANKSHRKGGAWKLSCSLRSRPPSWRRIPARRPPFRSEYSLSRRLKEIGSARSKTKPWSWKRNPNLPTAATSARRASRSPATSSGNTRLSRSVTWPWSSRGNGWTVWVEAAVGLCECGPYSEPWSEMITTALTFPLCSHSHSQAVKTQRRLPLTIWIQEMTSDWTHHTLSSNICRINWKQTITCKYETRKMCDVWKSNSLYQPFEVKLIQCLHTIKHPWAQIKG